MCSFFSHLSIFKENYIFIIGTTKYYNLSMFNFIKARCSDKANEGVFCPLNVCGCVKNLACRHIKMPLSMLQMSTPPNRPPTIKMWTPAMMKMWTPPMSMIPTIPDVKRVRRTFPPMRPGYYYRCV